MAGFNTVDILGLLFLGFGIIDGYRKGLVKKGTSLVIALVTLLVVYVASPYVETFFKSILPESFLPENFAGSDSELYRLLLLSGFGATAENYLHTLAARVLAVVVTYVVARILMRTLFFSLEILTKVPGLSFLNRFGGACLGFALQLLALWLFLLLVTIFNTTSWGNVLYELIRESRCIFWFYENNLLLLLGIMLLVVV